MLINGSNIDQTSAAFLQDVANTLSEEGVAAIVAVDTLKTLNVRTYDVRSLRVGRVVSWFARAVEVECIQRSYGSEGDNSPT